MSVRNEEAKVRPLNVFLLKKTVRTFKEALDEDAHYLQIKLKGGFNFTGVMYKAEKKGAPPTWLDFLQAGTNASLDDLHNQHQSILLLIKPNSIDRIFAYTFGYAKSLLNPGCYETNFGLRVTLNVVDPDKLRSVDAATLQETPINTRVQASKLSALEIFDINQESDLLQTITGTPKDKLADGTELKIGSIASGASSLLIRPNVLFEELGDLSEELLNYYNLKEYRTNGFEWVDHLQQITDKSLLMDLDKALLVQIVSKDVDKISLAPPEIMEWNDSHTIKYSGTRSKKIFSDFLIEDFYSIMGKSSDFTLDKLKNSYVNIIDSVSDQIVKKFPVYRCLNFETKIKTKQYILHSGNWYNVDVKYAKKVSDFISKLPEASIDLRPFNAKKDKTEGKYTASVCKSSLDFALMDTKTVLPTGARSRIEVCDIFSSSRQFVHIKPYKASATLSHLFAQGVVSGQLFQQDEGFRILVKSTVEKSRKTLGKLIDSSLGIINVSAYEIVYAIIKKNPGGTDPWQLSLPFFSQIMLMQSVNTLSSQMYKVSVKLIEKQ